MFKLRTQCHELSAIKNLNVWRLHEMTRIWWIYDTWYNVNGNETAMYFAYIFLLVDFAEVIIGCRSSTKVDGANEMNVKHWANHLAFYYFYRPRKTSQNKPKCHVSVKFRMHSIDTIQWIVWLEHKWTMRWLRIFSSNHANCKWHW